MLKPNYLQNLGLSGIPKQIEDDFELHGTSINDLSIDEYFDELRFMDIYFPGSWNFKLYDQYNSRRLYYGLEHPDPVRKNTLLLSTQDYSDCVGLGFRFEEEGMKILIEHIQTPSHISFEDTRRIKNELPVHQFELSVAGFLVLLKPFLKERPETKVYLTNFGGYNSDRNCHHKKRIKSLEDRFFRKSKNDGFVPLNPNKKRVQDLLGKDYLN